MSKHPIPQSDEERRGANMRDMQDTERYRGLTDLELISATLVDSISDDPRVFELMTRLYPDCVNERDSKAKPRFISFAVPIEVAYDFATFNNCLCDQSLGRPEETYRPCIYCACRIALFKATKDPSFQADDEHTQNGTTNTP